MNYFRALRRFWWVLVLGAAVSGLAAVVMVYKVDFSHLPPKLQERKLPTYATTARLLLTSAEEPYLRISVTEPVDTALPKSGNAQATDGVEGRPDIGILVRAANLYPLLIESDQVAELRTRMFGPLPGLISAQGIFSFLNVNRYEPTTLPVVEIFAASSTASGTIALAQGTVKAFSRYIGDQQDRAGLKLRERILLKPIQEPRTAVATGGTSLGLPLLVLFVLLAAFATLALLLDRLFPPVFERAAVIDRLDQRARVSDTA